MVTPMAEDYSDLQVQRILCAMYPSRRESVVDAVKVHLWRISEGGPIAWLGDRLDGLECWMREKRSRRAVEEMP